MRTKEQTDAELRDKISDSTGFDRGDTFQSEQEVRAFFTPLGQELMLYDDAITDDVLLADWADAVIDHEWHCEFAEAVQE